MMVKNKFFLEVYDETFDDTYTTVWYSLVFLHLSFRISQRCRSLFANCFDLIPSKISNLTIQL